MTILVTGSAGHLGEGIMRTLRSAGRAVVGIDRVASPFTDFVGSICDRSFVRRCLRDVDAIIHTAALHKPHVATQPAQAFVDINVSGTLSLLEESVMAGVRTFVFTSTTSAFGAALTPAEGQPAVWVTEDVAPIPKNIYGATKVAGENLCELFRRTHRLPIVVLRTSRFFPEADDDVYIRGNYELANVQVNELLYRRVDLEDVVNAHLLAVEHAIEIGFGRYIISATSPFTPNDLVMLRTRAAVLVQRRFPEAEMIYRARGWTFFPRIDRVYVNDRARADLGWRPKYDFQYALNCLHAGKDFRSALAREVGSKGYSARTLEHGPYPAE